MSSYSAQQFLPKEMLEKFRQRAATYDRENRFFQEDFDELAASGYLKLPIPVELGGSGMTLADVCREQRRLAYYAPQPQSQSTCTSTGWASPLTCIGLATSCQWILEDGARGEIFAAGHSESGNDLPVLYSRPRVPRKFLVATSSTAGRTSALYPRFGPALGSTPWTTPTRLHRRSCTRSCRARPKTTTSSKRGILLACGPRAPTTPFLRVLLFRTATLREWCRLDFAGADLFVLGIFAWAEPTFASVYLGLAERAFDIAVEYAKNKKSIAMGDRSMAYNPMVQYAVAEMLLELEAIRPHVDRTAERLVNRC